MTSRLQVPRVLLLIETSRIYGRQLVEGVGRYAREHGPWSFCFEERGVEELSVRQLGRGQVDGVISRLRDPRAARRLQATGLPVVELHGNPEAQAVDVTVDEAAVARLAADHLLDRGLPHLGFFAWRNEWWLQARRQAFVAELQRRGRTCDTFQAARPLSAGLGDPGRLQPDVTRWLRSRPKPFGLLCATDLEAMTVLEICRQIGLAVPDQLAVLGVDNDSVICSVTSPRLSSIDLDAQRVGYESAALLARMMAGQAKPRQPILVPPSQVVVRESTDVLAIADPVVVQAVRLIRQFACRGIGVSHVADHIAVGRRTLERRFRACLGRTLKDEILRVKIEQARMLLAQSDHPIKRISSMSGFGSLHYFTRAFRRETGESPAGYRRQAGGAGGGEGGKR